MAAVLKRDVVRAGTGARNGDQARLKGITVQVGRAQDQAVGILYILPDDAAALLEFLQAAGGYMFMVLILYMMFYLKLFQIIHKCIHASHRMAL